MLNAKIQLRKISLLDQHDDYEIGKKAEMRLSGCGRSSVGWVERRSRERCFFILVFILAEVLPVK